VSQSPEAGAHSCVVHPELKNAQSSLGGKYGRMFPALPSCEVDLDSAVALGRAASRMDATLPVVDEALENMRIPAGFVILGQFIAHDITADRSLLARHAVTGELVNSRIPRLDLECLYGDGPVGNPFLYEREDPDKLLLGADAAGEQDDLSRNHQGTGLVGDPRNDVHLLISQLHVAFLRFHNRAVDWLREKGVPDPAVFGEARRMVRWHYEWIVVHEFLPLSVGEEVVAGFEANGHRYYDPGVGAAIPVEFSDAAYRFGHSQIMPTYRLNDSVGEATIFPDCLGGRPVAHDRVIDWSWFFDISGAGHPPQPSRRLVASLTHALIDLPEQIVGHTEVPEHRSLAARDLQRGAALGLPSGEGVARAVGVEPLSAEECGLGSDWRAETPLWYYVLKEAEVRAGGEHLGPAGGRIVAEVLLGLLDADPGSYRNTEPGWRPTLPSAEPGEFGMADLVVFAGAGAPPGTAR
jgi:hypothetical protein